MNKEIFDVEELLERVQDDKELLVELLDIFTEDYQGKRDGLGAAATNNSFEDIRTIAHSLKGASGNISAKSLRLTLLELEDMGRDENLDGVEEKLSDLDRKYGELVVCMNELKEEYSS